ncbi:MAG: hypothetical protein II072_10070 [Clostridia bacterium]|nr:hypothetical protein [Clostridia bacterium]MBQ4166872.1 hypothetical protein [Clostridia bacterium]
MKIKRLITVLISVLLLCLAAVPASAEGELYIDTKTVYDGMTCSYSEGYIPTVENGEARIVLPLKGGTGSTLTVVPDLGDANSCPFVYGNYNMTVKRNNKGVFVVDLKLKLLDDPVSGVYPVVFNVATADGMTGCFTVYVTVGDVSQSGSGSVDFYISEVVCPDDIQPGSDFIARITLENIGGVTASGVKLQYSSDSPALTPVGSTHSMLLDDFAAGESREVELPLHFSRDAAAGRYSVNIELSCRTPGGNAMEARESFFVDVSSHASIAFDEPDLTGGVTEDTPVGISANVYNTGGVPVYDVFVSVEGQGVYSDLASLRVYYKSIQPGETAAGMITACFYSAANYLNQDGTLPVTLRVTYQDENGKQYEEKSVFNVSLLPAKAAEPATTPEPAKVNTQGQYWTILIAIISVIAVITAIAIAVSVTRRARI